MSWRYAPPVYWLCDGCGNETIGWSDRLPTAWVAMVDVDGDVPAGGIPVLKTTHRCPACQAKRPPEPAS